MDISKTFYPNKDMDVDRQNKINDFMDCFATLADAVNEELPESREKSLCLTKLQEAKMWCVECVAKN